MNQKTYIWAAGGVVVLLMLGLVSWFFFFRTSPAQTASPTNSFGSATSNNSTTVNTNTSSTDQNGAQAINNTGQQTSQSKVFQIANVAVVGATFIQMLHPTTTLARYIEQDNGHVFDLPVDVAGAIPRIVSNVTIPGGARAVWFENGAAAVMQYLSGNTIKTVYLGFPPATTTASTLPTKIQFFPDNIIDIAASPDGKNTAYLLVTSSGVDGYIAKSNGTSAKKLFSLPLSQVLISWPSQGKLLAQTKSAAGIAGIAFSIDATSGAVVPLLYAQGLTANADGSFAHIIYQTVQDTSSKPLSYLHNVKTGLDSELIFNPIPEKCINSIASTTSMYCAAPLQDVPLNYLDIWHTGQSSQPDTIYFFDLNKNTGSILAIPGGIDGGVASDISSIALSPDEHYLEFVTKGDRTLWGVRLTQ
jgi:hypothetical protein